MQKLIEYIKNYKSPIFDGSSVSDAVIEATAEVLINSLIIENCTAQDLRIAQEEAQDRLETVTTTN